MFSVERGLEGGAMLVRVAITFTRGPHSIVIPEFVRCEGR